MAADSNSARERLLASIRSGLGVTGKETHRKTAVARRLGEPARNLIPERAQRPHEASVDFFQQTLEGQGATVVRIAERGEIPTAIAGYLRGKNLPMRIRHGADSLWSGLPWDKEPSLERETGRAVGTDSVGLSRASVGVAETGTLVLTSGNDNPTTLNFLPETHLVVVGDRDIVGAYEQVWERLREERGAGNMPRTVNFVSGPSRTADIEQQLVMGAHGPRQMLVMIVSGD
jgi:L-lactate dehydrogenase complex protein LldG